MTDEWAANNKTAIWKFKLNSAPAQKITITREISVEAGKYTASVESDGGNIETGKIAISDGTSTKEAAMEFVDWDVWTTATTGVLEVAGSATITLTIEIDLKTEGWFDLDNVKVVAVSEDEAAAEKAKKITELQTLITECGSLVESEYTAESWQVLQDALTAANAVIEDKESKTVEEISGAYQALQTAKGGLAFSVPVVEGDLNVERIAGLPSDFIMGMDISSVMSEFASGVTYKDYEGNTIDNITDFCKLLKANGITHIRVRVWNDPFDADGNGYGGGNNDVATAKAIAEGCRAAGLKMLIDFHCSDFWADPGKQQVPKEWKGYTLDQKKDAVKSFIGTSLNTIDPSKDTVAMVQVGNETTGAFVGESSVTNMCVLFQAGAEAVKEYNSDVKVVIHVTNPEKGNVTKWAKNLSDNSVAYDIIATSYYPYWHGTLANLKSEFEKVRTTYGKDVMVAETSYAYTLTDSDGHDNTARVGNNDIGADTTQPFTVQGQATAIRNLINTVNEAGGLGVYYWEPAWLTVGDTRGLTGDDYDAQVNANKVKWEEHGSGWASSYAAEYDPDDAGKWFGGSAVDNEAMFYPDGSPTAALHVWNYVKTGAVNSSVSVDQVGTAAETIEVDGTYTLPGTVTVSYNTGNEEDPVTWENTAIDASKPGSYVVKGTVTFSKTVNSGEYSGKTTAETTYTLTIIPPNLITDRNDAGFEKGNNFTVEGSGISSIPASDDPYAGTKSMHWYSASATQGTVTYDVGITLEAGEYTFEAKAQGAEGDQVTLKILDGDGNVLFAGEPAAVGGWKNWQTPSVSFTLDEETEVYLQIVVDMQDGGWGTADALYLYQVPEKEYTISYNLNGGTNASDNPKTYKATDETIELKPATRDDYTFEGWYSNEALTTEVTEIVKGSTGNVTLYAKWAPITYTITYVLNGGTNASGNPADYTVETETITLAAASRDGYVFEGWYSDEELTTKVTAITKGTTGNIKLYAKWTELTEGTYVITYVLDGGTNAAANPATYKETDETIVLEAATKDGYTFEGWYSDAEFTSKVTEIQKGSTGNKTLYAKWKKNASGDDNKDPEETAGTVTSESKVEAGAPATSMTSDVEVLQNAVLTQEDLEKVEAGKDANIYLEVKNIDETVSESDKALVEAELGNRKLGVHMDISLFKQVGDDPAEKVTNTNGKISISIKIPQELINTDSSKTRTYRIIRVHDGEAVSIDGSYDAKTGTFTFETDAFSTYALVYEDVPVSSGNTNTPTTPTTPITPTTPSGDTTTTITGNLQYDGWAGVSAEQKAKLMQESLAQNAAVTTATTAAPATDDNGVSAAMILLFMMGCVLVCASTKKKLF